MWFINRIVDAFDLIADWSNWAYLETRDWSWPFYHISDFFYYFTAYIIRIAVGFIELGEFLEDVADEFDRILDEWEIRGLLRYWLDRAEWAWSWVSHAFDNVWDIVSDWWDYTQLYVKQWIQDAEDWLWAEMEKTRGWLHEVRTWWFEFIWRIPTIDQIISWFGSWTGNVIASVIAWGALTAAQVAELIDSKIAELDPMWEAWQEVMAKVVQFFTDPVEFIWERFTDWFLGPEG